ncbi:MAG TPA: EamA family transporter [Candidatus Bathyarchaeia archaeon]|nr:EamA family transporter [Candidatus Bathyarchaeia archaeon]
MMVIQDTAPRTTRPGQLALLLAFAVIYVVWGSTYLAIRYAVETIPPLLAVVLRQGLAGGAIFAYAWRQGYRPSLREWRASAVLGVLYFAIGHGTLHWAETIVPSGLAALLTASEPIWIAAMAALVSRDERVTTKTVLGLLLGVAGVALLLRADADAGPSHRHLLLGCVVILIGTLSWSAGVIYSRNAALPRDPVARAGMAAMTGAGLLFFAALGSGEVLHAHPSMFSARSVGALLYLIVFGSIITFTTYTWLLDHCSPTLVATHTYANPIIAVILGWLFAGEALDRRLLLAGLVTLLAVFLISRGTTQPTNVDGQRLSETA